MSNKFSKLNPLTGQESASTDGLTEFNAIRSRMIDYSVNAAAVVAVPALAGSLYRAVDIGWIPAMTVHSILAVLIIALALIRKRVPYTVRAGVVIALFFVLGATAVVSFGLATNGRTLFIAACVLTVLFFGIWEGVIVFSLCVAFNFMTYALIQNGTIVHDFDVSPLLHALSAWIASAATLLLLFASSCLPMALLLRQLNLALARSERDRSSLALAHETSEKFFSKAFHSSPLILAVSDPRTGKYYDVNQACIDISGYSREEFLNSTSFALNVWANTEDRNKLIAGLNRDGRVRDMEITMRAKDGKLRDVLLSADLIATQDGDRILVIGQDISRLKEVARMKSDFISTVSHELRTPITSIVGALKLANDANIVASRETKDNLLSIALKNSARLAELVNDLLDVDKLQSGSMVFDMRRVDLAAIATEAMNQNQTFARESGVRFVAERINGPIYVKGDASRLNQVMVNILSNAAKFSPRDTDVVVSVDLNGGYGRIEVADRGPGIPDSFRTRLFERFTQADSSDARKVQGSGLGLNICKSIVDAHAGRIDFRPNSGGGTVFYFDIPLWLEESRDTAGVATPYTAFH